MLLGINGVKKKKNAEKEKKGKNAEKKKTFCPKKKFQQKKINHFHTFYLFFIFTPVLIKDGNVEPKFLLIYGRNKKRS